MISVNIGNVSYEYEDGTTIYEIAKDFKKFYENDIILAVCNGKLSELSNVLTENCIIKFITTASHIGSECYKRSVTFMMLKAFYKVAGRSNVGKISVEHSVSKGYYCAVGGGIKVDNAFVKQVKEEMNALVKRDILITKEVVSVTKAIEKFGRYGMKDKEHLLKYRRASTVNVYKMEALRTISMDIWHILQDVLNTLI